MRVFLVLLAAGAAVAQESLFSAAFECVEKWIKQRAFPGAVLAIGEKQSVVVKAFGRMEYAGRSAKMRADTIFDLASISKPVGTATAIALLYEQGKVELDTPVVRYLPEFGAAAGHDEVTVRQLLTHSAGIPNPPAMYRKAYDKSGILEQIFPAPLASPPGTRVVYRDTNFILLGEIIERLSGLRQSEFLERHVFRPLGMKDTMYTPAPKLARRIAPTEMDRILRNRVVAGSVHDENCYVMGGVCGHAGLFSTARDLAVFARMMLDRGAGRGRRILRQSTVGEFAARQPSPAGTSRALGWDTPREDSFAGKLASPRAIMHTGFTGGSIYIDFGRDAFVILLSNRVHPTRNNSKVSAARPEIHDAVLGEMPLTAGPR